MVNKSKLTLILLVLVISLATMTKDVYGEALEQAKTSWYIPFFARLEVPQPLIIVDGKDVIMGISKFFEMTQGLYPTKNINENKKKVSPEDLEDVFDQNQLHFYQFALKDNGSYQTAFAFVGRVPAEWDKPADSFLKKLQLTDQTQQQEIHKSILRMMSELSTKAPDLKDVFQVEILEFYPFEGFTNKNAQIVSIGGSVALHTFHVIQPAAFKIYIINRNAKLYFFGVINSGLDRKIWDTMTKDMLSTAQWSLVN